MTRVHILLHGFPLCGFSMKVPKDWPEGHRWEHVENADNTLNGDAEWCKDCQQRKKQMNVE